MKENKTNILKKLLMVLVGRFARGHAKQIGKAQKWIDNAQATFASAIEEAQIAEERFNNVVSDAEKKIAELQETVSEVNQRKEQATKFKNKIQTFIED